MTLPDILEPGLRVVFCGTAVATASALRGHYYAGPANEFWQLLHLAGFTDRQLDPADDHTLPSHGLGLTDLNKTTAQSHDRGLVYDVPGFEARIAAVRPDWVALHGKEAAKALGHGRVRLGTQDWLVAERPVFVLPSASGANRRADYDGRPDRLSWWRELAELVA